MISAPAQQVSAENSTDELLLRTWLNGRSANTRRAYERDARACLASIGRSASAASIADLQAWSEGLAGLALATRNRKRAAVKSLFRFAKDMGFADGNPAAPLRLERADSAPAQRILAETTVLKLIGAEVDVRRRALLRLLYVCGLRRSEVPPLRWRDLTGNEKKGGVARVLGKGGKLRQVEIPAALWRELLELTPDPRPDSPLIPGRDGKPIHEKAVYRIVKRAAGRLGSEASPHWMRHSHASHALDRGASLAAVRDGLGHASIATTGKYLHAKPGEGSASFIRGG